MALPSAAIIAVLFFAGIDNDCHLLFDSKTRKGKGAVRDLFQGTDS